MPYFMQKRGGQYCVVKGTKKDPGETKKCHPKRQDALDHLAALYVHVEDAGKDKAAPATGGTSNLPHGPGSMLGATASQLGNDKKPKKKSKSCVCPKCGAKKTTPAGKPCSDIKCPKCGAKMEGRSGAAGKKASTKAIAMGEGRIGGYLILWGSPAEKDLVEEYFTPETDFWLDKWGSTRPLFYDHGRDPGIVIDGRAIKLAGPDALIGTIDTLEPDEVGLWMEAQLDRRRRYLVYIQGLIESEEGMGLSSGALPNKDVIVREPDGYIKVWPIVEGSLAPTPCEHRMANVEVLKAVLGEDFDKEVSTMEDEKTIWTKFGERLGFINKSDPDDEEVTTEATTEEADETATDETAQQTTQASALPAEEDREEDKEEKKSTSFPEVVVDEVVIKAISTRVVTAMTGSLAEVVAPIQQELDELKAWREKVIARLDAAEKSIEEKAAEWVANLPPIVKVRASEVKTTATDEVVEGNAKTPREQRQKEWSATFADIIDTALSRGETIESMEEV